MVINKLSNRFGVFRRKERPGPNIIQQRLIRPTILQKLNKFSPEARGFIARLAKCSPGEYQEIDPYFSDFAYYHGLSGNTQAKQEIEAAWQFLLEKKLVTNVNRHGTGYITPALSAFKGVLKNPYGY